MAVRYYSWYISLPSSAKQFVKGTYPTLFGEMNQEGYFILVYVYLELNAMFQI